MIIEEKLDKPYGETPIKCKVWFRCDYCGTDFQRTKRNRERGNITVNKDSCTGCKKAKQKDVCLRLYGSESIFGDPSFKEKKQKSIIEKFGTEKYHQTDEFKEKRKNTNLSKYGVEEYFLSDEFKQKSKSAFMEKYGVDNPIKSEEIIERRRVNNLNKYGFAAPMQIEEVKKKKEKTCKERYGDGYMKTEEYRESVKKNCLEKYGVEHTSQLPDTREKAKQTCLEKYGVDSYTKTHEWAEKFKNTCIERYGVEHSSMSEEVRQKRIETCLRRFGESSPCKTAEILEKIQTTCLERYGTIHPPNNYCLQQNEIGSWLKLLGYDFQSNRSVLSGREIDLYNDELKVGIEFNGLFWHNELSKSPKDKNYHYKKYLECSEFGIRLISIFEDEWKERKDQCKNYIRSSLGQFDERIYARKCKVVKVDRKETVVFCDRSHVLGGNITRIVQSIGLVLAEKLVGIIVLGKHHRQNVKGMLTIKRLCFSPGIQVVGGASKLLSACVDFAKTEGFSNIVTWSDNRWSTGKIYNDLGFALKEELNPDYCYVFYNHPVRRFSKQSMRKKAIKCPDGITEVDWNLSRGFARIWDCGKKRWEMEIK